MNNKAVVSVSHLYKSFGTGENETAVLKDISFKVTKGEFVSVMGPSGCGKSTLLYLIGGLDTPTSGRIITCDSELYNLNDARQSALRCRKIGFVFQFYNLVQNLTVEENIILPLVMAGRSVKKEKDRVNQLLQIMGLESKRNDIPSRLSGGQQQRVSVARAIVTAPDLLLADEPTGNLDSRSGTEVMKLFQQINREMGITVIMVTHSAESATYGTRTIFLQDGVIQKDTARTQSAPAAAD